jgi:hypothetical protein
LKELIGGNKEDLMEFKKYQHVERYGTEEVEGINIGTCYIMPKIDGSNGTAFLNNNGELCFGSRKRQLTAIEDNQGFYNKFINDERLINYFKKYPNHRLYGEYMKPHSLRTYREEVWNKFYIFDVCEENEAGELRYIPFDEYKYELAEFGLDYIPVIGVVTNGDYEDFIKYLEKNTYLIKDGKGIGEGIVIKNYDYKNKYGRTTWAKIVTNEFKEKHRKEHGVPVIDATSVEEKIIEKYVTDSFIEKEYQKIIEEKGGWKSEYIPMLLNKIYHEFITEESWNMIKSFKFPIINFKKLNLMCTAKIKNTKSELF